LFLKTTIGRGSFDLFCASLFIVTGGIAGYCMAGVLAVCGVFFIVTGVVMRKDLAGGDFNNKEIATKASVTGYSALA
jgi:hypothetical protein